MLSTIIIFYVLPLLILKPIVDYGVSDSDVIPNDDTIKEGMLLVPYIPIVNLSALIVFAYGIIYSYFKN